MPHWIIYGMTDSGKSYFVKKEFILDPDVYNNKKIIIIDVTGEYEKYRNLKYVKYYFVDNSEPDDKQYKKIDSHVLDPTYKKMVIIDECHLIGDSNSKLMKYIVKWVTIARKQNTEMIILTQRPQLIHSKTPHSQSYYRLFFAMDDGDIEALRQGKYISKKQSLKLIPLDVDKHEFIIQEKKQFEGPYIL